jgi:ATP-binding cassette, subfamily B, bacterial HlyB/CyaB
VASDSGIDCLVLLLGFHHIGADPQQLRHALGTGEAATSGDLVRLARRLGARSKITRLSFSKIEGAPLPIIGRGKDGQYFILARVHEGQALIQRPEQPPESVSFEHLSAI